MDSLSIYLVTWNVAGKYPDECLNDLLSFEGNKEKLPDLYIIGLQEVKSQIHNIVLDALFDDPWTAAFKSKLKTKKYIKLKTIRLQGIVLSIFSKKEHLLSIRDIDVQYTKTGFGGLWGNKGCVAARMNAYGVSVCIVNTHLTPHDQNLDSRVDDYNHIIKETFFLRQKETTLILYHDYVFWIGDHNFRLEETVSQDEILNKIASKELKQLKNRDQLMAVMKSGLAFSELTEESFDFAPTYKFLFNSSEYDPKRRPAWTDRILYRVNANAYENVTLDTKMKLYKSFPHYSVSDHKPVAGEFVFKVFSDYIERVVEFEIIQEWRIDQENLAAFVPSDDVSLSDWDWIGIYKADFSSLDEYVSFVYLNQIKTTSTVVSETSTSKTGRKKEIHFPDGLVRSPGRYCLLYVTADSASVLGMSATFEAKFLRHSSLNFT